MRVLTSAAVPTVILHGAARNAPCSCGSGRKYKHCCLAAEKRAAGALRFDEAVGNRIEDWAAKALGEEIGATPRTDRT